MFSSIADYVVPLTILGILLYGCFKGVNVFESFISGAKEGVTTAFNILPALVVLTTAVGMLKASGAMDVLSFALSPLSSLLQIPREIIPLALLRPISGSSALVLFGDILASHGPDSYVGQVASVMMGSTETTFYTIAVYFGASKITETRHTLPASLTADLVGFVMSAALVRLMLG